jgi:Xaa-Pro dipeptidase
MGIGRPWGAAILLPDREPLLHASTPGRAEDLAVSDHWWHRQVTVGVADAIKSHGIGGRVALCNTSYLPVKYADAVRALMPGVQLVPEDDLIRAVRKVKSTLELDCFREGGRLVSSALSIMFDRLIGGASEAEAAGAAAQALMRQGGNFHMIPITHGPYINEWCTDPLNGYAPVAPSAGDLVRAWIYGPVWQGCWMDPGRTAVVGGNATTDQRELIEGAAGIVERCIAAIRPGVPALEIAELGERLRCEAGGGQDMASEMWPFFGPRSRRVVGAPRPRRRQPDRGRAPRGRHGARHRGLPQPGRSGRGGLRAERHRGPGGRRGPDRNPDALDLTRSCWRAVTRR